MKFVKQNQISSLCQNRKTYLPLWTFLASNSTDPNSCCCHLLHTAPRHMKFPSSIKSTGTAIHPIITCPDILIYTTPSLLPLLSSSQLLISQPQGKGLPLCLLETYVLVSLNYGGSTKERNHLSLHLSASPELPYSIMKPITHTSINFIPNLHGHLIFPFFIIFLCITHFQSLPKLTSTFLFHYFCCVV